MKINYISWDVQPDWKRTQSYSCNPQFNVSLTESCPCRCIPVWNNSHHTRWFAAINCILTVSMYVFFQIRYSLSLRSLTWGGCYHLLCSSSSVFPGLDLIRLHPEQVNYRCANLLSLAVNKGSGCFHVFRQHGLNQWLSVIAPYQITQVICNPFIHVRLQLIGWQYANTGTISQSDVINSTAQLFRINWPYCLCMWLLYRGQRPTIGMERISPNIKTHRIWQ